MERFLHKRSKYVQRVVRSLLGLTTAVIGGANMLSIIILASRFFQAKSDSPLVVAAFMPVKEKCEQARELTPRYGKNPISYGALSENRSYFFSSSKQSMLSYALPGSTAVVTGDTIGPDREMVTVLHEFLAFCDQLDWTNVFWQVRAERRKKLIRQLERQKLGAHHGDE